MTEVRIGPDARPGFGRVLHQAPSVLGFGISFGQAAAAAARMAEAG